MDESVEPNVESSTFQPRAVYPPRIFNCRIAELREEHPEKPTIHSLAQAIGVTPLTMSRIENGCDLKLSNAVALANVFGKKIEDLWPDLET